MIGWWALLLAGVALGAWSAIAGWGLGALAAAAAVAVAFDRLGGLHGF